MAQLPDWSPLRSVSPPASDGSGRIVAVVATDTATQQGWAASTALDLARGWSSGGHRVILVDTALAEPSLHAAADLPNHEGLTDAVLYGASVARVSHAVDDGNCYLITAGTPIADPGTVVKSGRWHRVAEGMTQAGVLVLLYLRAGDRETAAFLGAASDVVLLAGPGDPAPPVVEDLLPLVRAVTGPEVGPSARVAAKLETERMAASGKADATSRGKDPLMSPPAAKGGIGRAFLLLVAALLVAAGLGYLLTAVL